MVSPSDAIVYTSTLTSATRHAPLGEPGTLVVPLGRALALDRLAGG